jgi:hypothetical protein
VAGGGDDGGWGLTCPAGGVLEAGAGGGAGVGRGLITF